MSKAQLTLSAKPNTEQDEQGRSTDLHESSMMVHRAPTSVITAG